MFRCTKFFKVRSQAVVSGLSGQSSRTLSGGGFYSTAGHIIVGTLLIVLTLFPWSSVFGQDDEDKENLRDELPQLSEMELPDFESLMKDDPYDWIVLKDGSVIVSVPVYPRPDTLEKIAQERAELEAAGGRGNAQQRQQRRQRLIELRKLEITLPDDQSVDYDLPLPQIDQIIGFEDLMLRRIDALLGEGDITKAYEMLRSVEQQAPGWKKTIPRFNRLLLREAELKVEDGDIYAALALLDELAAKTEQNSDAVASVMAATVDGLIKSAVDEQDYDRAGYFLSRLSGPFPKHATAAKWNQYLDGRMRQLLSEADQQAASGDFRKAAALAREANRVLPTTGNLRAAYSQHVLRYQTLRVPVRSFSGANVISPVPLEADRRHQELIETSLFEAYATDELTYFRSGYFDVWDPRDLGREVVFSIRQTRPYWQTQPILTANQIADTLGRKLTPGSPDFSPRLASFISRFSVPSPTQLQISFYRVPLNLEALFRFPVTAASDGGEGQEGAKVLSTRFALVEQNADRRVYQRTVPEPDGLTGNQYHVAEIVEQKYPDRHAEIQAFNRKEVDLIPHLRPWEIDIFKASGIGFVQQYAIPRNHVIVFNPRSESVRSPQLRRALSFGIDREKMLEVVILRDPDMKYGRVVSAPWHSGSYANSPLVEDPKYDHYLSFLLRLAALEQLRIPDKQKFVAEAKAKALEAEEDWDEEMFRLGHADEINAVAEHIQLPKLRMLCDADDVAILAAEKMVDRWKLLGFDIELIRADTEGEAVGDDGWDLMYRVTRVEEPLLDLWPLLLTDNKFDVDRLSAFPDWMRQELINLDYSTSFQDAQERMFTIHRHMAAQAFLIPLWELDDFVVFQRNLSGFEGRPLRLYDGVERWMVKP